ncbi:MAG: DUF4830 domain-containing protein [Ruminococcaceae bacterium]|nr:DUF4830 domain-containing protein [Oscillospiraceae bacterium]MBO4972528.1 DUF4830 domain-containing protein [Clostridia bacterium]MBQ1259848.1 DUF4830 domain-containing protein [Clostridia bacterium]
MFVYSMKASTLKFFGIVSFAMITLIVLLAFIEPYEPVNAEGNENAVSISYGKIKGAEDVKSFLAQFGWNTSAEPVETKNVIVPKQFDRVLSEYNEIQRAQGLNLEKYKGKSITRYTFVVENYPDYESTVYANVLVYKNKVVGGDICAADNKGFIHGFEMGE